MSRQIPLEFGDGLRAQEVVTQIDRAMVDLVDAITTKEAAWRLDTSSATLHRKLHREDRNQISLREAVILLASAAPHLARAAIEPLVRAIGCEMVESKPLTAEEELERLKEVLAEELSPTAKERLLRKARGR